MKVLQKQISLFTEEQLTLLQEDSLARMQVLQNNTVRVNRGLKVNVQGYSLNFAEQSGKSDQNLLLPKTWLTFLKLTKEKTLAEYSPNYPHWGIMQNGEFVELQKSVPPISVPGCISLLTPVASECKRDKLSFPFFTKRHHRSPGALSEQLYRLFGAVPGFLNPQFYAWMMGFPKNWVTEAENSEGKH
jgi:hypothetical protein